MCYKRGWQFIELKTSFNGLAYRFYILSHGIDQQ